MLRVLALTIILTGAFFAGPAAACGPPQTPTPSPTAIATPVVAWQVVKGEDYEGVIVPEKDAPRFFAALEEEHGRYWTPDATVIERLEAGIEDYLGELAKRASYPCGPPVLPPSVVERLADYRRQYAGFVVEESGHLIRANFFCDARGREWKSDPVVAAGGGKCFFRLTYSPTSESYVDLQINAGGWGVEETPWPNETDSIT